jgi:hypothetical protein
MQILKLGMGDAETYMINKLEESLTQGNAFSAIENTIDSLLKANRVNTDGENITMAHQLSI